MSARIITSRIIVAAVAATSIAACTGPRITPEPIITLPASQSPEPTASESPSPYQTYTPSPTPSATTPATPTPEPTGGAIVSNPQGEPVTPEIFQANYYPDDEEVAVVVFVRDVYETGGSCVVTATAGARTFSQENVGEADVSGTACGLFTFDVSDVTSSSIDVVAYYTSNGHEGLSNTVKVDIS